ncbi:sugar kinase [uncultured Aeromicrobium sp.]|uniref:sugar kinase n=1 Tax=uncultured Aeromicrobium sp. TaxID=337820 RepID=UPI0025E52956|nr:sugar kinase [uncultured Aeromicrobium sp.]
MAERIDVFCAGETMVMVTPADGSGLRPGAACLLHAGGAESNVAGHLAKLGHRVAWAGALGADPLGDLVVEELATAGVDTSDVVRDPTRRTGVYFKDSSPDGTTVYYYRDDSAAAAMSASTAQTWPGRRPRIVHVSGITAALSQGCLELLHHIVIDRAFGDALVSFDVNFRPSLWADQQAAASQLRQLASASDIVFVGRDEAERLWHTRTAEDVRTLLHDVPHLVVKDGGHAATEFSGAHVTSCPAPRVEVVEPVGAGDAFAAGWLAGVLRHLDPVRRLRLGHLIASRVLGSPSDAAALPEEPAITAMIDTDPAQWPAPSPITTR